MNRRRAVTAAMIALLASCADLTSPGQEMIFTLESIDEQTLPLALAVDYDLTVELLGDEITLRSDSTFLEVVHIRGTFSGEHGDPMSIAYADSAAGSYSLADGRLFLLQRNRVISQLEYDGMKLRLSGQRTFVYRRRP